MRLGIVTWPLLVSRGMVIPRAYQWGAPAARFCDNGVMSDANGINGGSLPSGLCLVTGATGFVGSAVAKALLRAGHPVRVLARRGGDRRNLAGLAVEIAEGSLDRPET